MCFEFYKAVPGLTGSWIALLYSCACDHLTFHPSLSLSILFCVLLIGSDTFVLYANVRERLVLDRGTILISSGTVFLAGSCTGKPFVKRFHLVWTRVSTKPSRQGLTS